MAPRSMTSDAAHELDPSKRASAQQMPFPMNQTPLSTTASRIQPQNSVARKPVQVHSESATIVHPQPVEEGTNL